MPLLRAAAAANAPALKVASFVMLMLWVFFGSLLYVFEHHDNSFDKGAEQSWRYSSILHGLTYSLIHLTGDFPLISYTWGARKDNIKGRKLKVSFSPSDPLFKSAV